ncbi:MAG: alpha/beta hydrolase [Acidobacteria bacterium]|nr:alpha/beta hydrolase [Acidobacteriota bacterium]
MKIVDRGGGTPVVVIPGIQGRWEWMKPAIDALAQRCRVITFSLADEPSCGGLFDATRGFRCYVEQVRAALDAARVGQAGICGVSYGGLIAAAFAARYPERASSLVLVSPLPPSWKPDRRARFYVRAPRLLTPIFLLASLRMYPEIAAASGGFVRGLAAGLRPAWRVLTHMFSPRRMARRVGLLAEVDVAAELRRVTQPTLVITGESALDRVVPVHATREYAKLWSDVRFETIARTGHLGLITRPDEFARLVVSFADHAAHGPALRRRVG